MPHSVHSILNASRWPESDSGALAAEIMDLCELARGLAEARAVRLVLVQAQLADLAPDLVRAGLECRVDGTALPAATPPAPFRLTTGATRQSDTLSLGVPVLRKGEAAALIELIDARPDALGARHAQTLCLAAQFLSRRLSDLAGAGSRLAPRLLALIAAVSEHDEAAGSRVLTGLLHLAAGYPPSMVEVTALRIAGLADLAGARVVLTPEGRMTLARAGITQIAQEAAHLAHDGVETARRPVPAPRSKPRWTAFARLAIADGQFDIAEGGEDEPLAFRPTGGHQDWTELRNGLADGWAEIAAEVLGRTADIVREYVKMHMIRRRDVPMAEMMEIYDLHGMEWWVRPSETGHETCVAGEEWQPLTIHLDTAPQSGPALAREWAITALIQLWPDLADKIGHDVRSWARRMATGAQVIPMTTAA